MRYIYLLTAALLSGFQAFSQVRLPQLVSDHMVLQRDAKVNVWGWASAGEKIRLTIAGKTYHATADASGKWKLALAPHKAGGPFTVNIDANNHLTINDVLFGDVWFCSGQSNMVLQVERVKEKYPDEIPNADFPQIRNFFVPTVSDVSHVHEDLPPGKWSPATPATVGEFGAASWFFAKDLYQKYHVPIGIINSSVGGTPVQAWVSEEALKSTPYEARIAQLKDTAYMHSLMRRPMPRQTLPVEPDQGLSGAVKWYDTAYVAKGWHKFWLPGYWADQGIRGLNGVVWFRKEIDLPANWAGKTAKLFVGRIVDADETYVNGVKVGNVTYQYPPRRYTVPAGVLTPGKNIIVVRVTNTMGKGGFVPDKNYVLQLGDEKIDLRGEWQYKVGQVFPPVTNFGGSGGMFSAQNEPAGLYNTMVAPAVNYTIKGFLWYQGEANTGKPKEYRQLLTALINDWRTRWNEGPLPFLYVQLPNFNEVQYWPSESQWAELREQELQTLAVPNTAMAVAIDAGEWNDIHPLDKKDVGDRLAAAAENLAYHEHTESMGPVFQSAEVKGNQIIISFTHVDGGLIAKDGEELQQFAIAGADKRFIWAKARIEGDKVVVYSDHIANPVYVRYAWADNPEGANLFNKAGLPASPFRTDVP